MITEKAEIIEVIALDTTNTNNINIPVSIVNQATMKKISTTDTVCEIITIAKKKKLELSEFKKANKIILLDSIYIFRKEF